MYKQIKKYLKFLFLAPIFPIIGVEGATVNDEGSTNESSEGENNNDNNGNENNTNESKSEKTFTQAELDIIVGNRLKKAEKKFQTEHKLALEREKLNDVEKLKLDLENERKNTDNKIAMANSRLIKSHAISALTKENVIDIDAVYALLNKDNIEIDDNGNITGVENAITLLKKEKPHLFNNSTQVIRAGDDSNKAGTPAPKGKNFDMNYLLRKATGRL